MHAIRVCFMTAGCQPGLWVDGLGVSFVMNGCQPGLLFLVLSQLDDDTTRPHLPSNLGPPRSIAVLP